MSAQKQPTNVVMHRIKGVGLTPVVPVREGGMRPATRAEVIRMDIHRKGDYQNTTDKNRMVVHHWETIIAEVERLRGRGSQNSAVKLFITRAEIGDLPPRVLAAAKAVAVGGRACPSESTIHTKLKAIRDRGIDGLVKKHQGRVRIEGGWEGFALERFSQSTQPDIAAIHRELIEIHGFKVGYEQVRGYINSLPASLGRMSPARIGANLFRLSQTAFFRRSIDNALPGDIYTADGYLADIYVAHPISGDIFRPELTVGMDVASRYIVHVRADEHEGTYAVQNMWAEAFNKWNHVPLQLYVDNGTGHKNHNMCDEVTGFYVRAGVQHVIFAHPGNPHGKGWIERFFRTMKDDFIRVQWAQFCCADEQSDEVLNRVTREVKAGRITLPTLEQFMNSLNDWLERYHNRPHPDNKEVTRAEVWARLEPKPPVASLEVMKYRSTPRKVRRATLTHGGREYGHPSLLQWNGQQVVLDYSLTDDAVAVVRTMKGEFICDAHLVSKKKQFSDNRLEDLRAKREGGQLKRLERKMDEQKARAGRVIDADALADALLIEGESTRIADDGEPLLLDLNDID